MPEFVKHVISTKIQKVFEKQLKLTARDLGYTNVKPEIVKNFVGIT